MQTKTRAALLLGTVFFCLLYLAGSLFYLYFGNLNEDEGWYLCASRMVYSGHFPYKDFAYTQTPLLPYIYGCAGRLFGFSLTSGRAFGVVLGFLTLVMAVQIARALKGDGAGALTAFLMCTSLPTFYFNALTKTNGLTAFLVAFSFWALLRKGGLHYLSLIAICAAACTRLAVLPAAFVWLGFLICRSQGNLRREAALAGTFVLALLAFGGWLILMEPTRGIFNIWDFHLRYVPYGEEVRRHFSMVKLTLLEVFCYYYLHLTFLVVAFVALCLGRSAGRFAREKVIWAGMIVLVNALIFAGHLGAEGVGSNYFSMVAWGFAVVSACGIVWLVERCRQEPRTWAFIAANLLTWVVLVPLIGALVHPRTLWPIVAQQDFWRRNADIRAPQMKGLREAASYIRSTSSGDAVLLTFDTYVAVESGRGVLHGLEMSLFSYNPYLSTEQCVFYNVVNDALLCDALRSRKADLLVFTDMSLRMIGLSSDSSGHLNALPGRDAAPGLAKAVEQGYRLERRFLRFGQWEDVLYVYCRRPGPSRQALTCLSRRVYTIRQAAGEERQRGQSSHPAGPVISGKA